MGNGTATGTKQSRSERFVSTSIADLKSANHNPISGYEHLPILKLEDAVKNLVSIVPGLMTDVDKAKAGCNQNSTLLSHDESAAIYIYTMPIPFFGILNSALRAKNRDALKPWFPFLKLFLAALEKLPSLDTVIWRGVGADVGSDLKENTIETWWSINSCSKDTNVVELYLATTGTVFAIRTTNGKDISSYSRFDEEREVVLMPGTRLCIKSKPLAFEKRLFIVHMEDENKSEKKPEKQVHLNNTRTFEAHSSNQNEIKSSLHRSINLSFIQAEPFKRQSLSQIINNEFTMGFGSVQLKGIWSNDECLILYDGNTLYLLDANLKLVHSIKDKMFSLSKMLDMTWCACIRRFIIISQTHAYAFDPNTARLTCLETIQLKDDEKRFISCACLEEALFIATAKSYRPSYVNHYNLRDFMFVDQYTVIDLIGPQIPSELTNGRIETVSSADSDEREIITIRTNEGRLALILKIKYNYFLYTVNLRNHPFTSAKRKLPSKKCRLRTLPPSHEWLVVCDGYGSKIMQVSLDCEFTAEYDKHRASSSNELSSALLFALNETVDDAVMMGSSRFVMVRDDNLEMYCI